MKTRQLELEGKSIVFETGRMARQADGSALVSQEGTSVLVTAVASKGKETDKDFFPLFVEYREKFYAAGKIPGGFFKREGRPSEREVLACRLIDRPIRPMFPDNFRYEVQVACSVLSSDKEHQSDTLGITGASLALNLSDIPFDAVLSGVRVGREDNNFIMNPTFSQVEEGGLDLVIAGTDEAIIMVEGCADEIDESLLMEALEFGHTRIKELNRHQREFIKECSLPEKRTFDRHEIDPRLEEKVRDEFAGELKSRSMIKGKLDREAAVDGLVSEVVEKYSEEYPESENEIREIMGNLERQIIRDMIISGKKRVDGRSFDDIRDISCEVEVLDRSHGSALFTRGETQSLVAATLGTSQDEQRIDALTEESWKKFMLHYNFPPFSVGEVGFFRGPGRREIGHGVLAEKALKPIIPSDDVFPYTIRLVSDILESNGSSSMATVCGGSLALMDAGVPVDKAVAGVAMGLVKEGDQYAILADIQGLEDHLGDMDFKVAGTRDGITAFQMDVKIAGIEKSLMKESLANAHQARMKILDVMDVTISEARSEISPYAPKIVQLKIAVDKIGNVIGPGGKVVRNIQEVSGARVEIDDDGTILIAAVDRESSDKAIQMIEEITAEPELNKVYKGKVRSIVKFGAFVEILPGQDGLLHISEIAHERIGRVEDVLSLGDEIEVKVIGIDNEGKIRLSRKALL